MSVSSVATIKQTETARPSVADALRSLLRDRVAWSVRDVVWLSVSCGLAAGWIEAAYWCVKRFALHDFTYVHDDVFWMAPTAYLVLFAILGFVAGWLARRIGHPAAQTCAIIVLTMAGLLCPFQLFPRIYFAAQLLLALGVATQVGRWSEQNPRHARHLTRWISRSLLALTVIVAGGELGYRWYAERQHLAALPPAADRAPNVVLIVLDTVRADALGIYGAGENPTPELDALARRGVLFEHASSTAPWTLPATASIMTGRLPSEMSADWLTPLDSQQYTLPELMRDNGYATAGIVANHKYATVETGLARGFAHYNFRSYSPFQFVSATALGRTLFFSRVLPNLGCDRPLVRRKAREVSERYLAWADAHQDRPHFALLNYFDVHDPYLAPEAFRKHRPANSAQTLMLRFWWFVQRNSLTSDEAALAWNAYTDCLRYLDDEIGRLIDELDSRNALDNTVVVITADHGEHFGEHKLWLHGNSLYEPLVHVPLLVIAPGRVPEGRRISQPVSTADIAATIQDVLRLPTSEMPGRSLAALWDGTETEPRPVISEVLTPPITPPCQGASPIFRGSMRSIRLGDLKLIRNEDGGEELFDLAGDPSESHNLALLPERQPDLERLRALLESPHAPSSESEPARLTADR